MKKTRTIVYCISFNKIRVFKRFYERLTAMELFNRILFNNVRFVRHIIDIEHTDKRNVDRRFITGTYGTVPGFSLL
jgi:hypothetical protein